MVSLGSSITYTDVSKNYKISSCDLLHVFFLHILPGPLHASYVVYVFELPVKLYPKVIAPAVALQTLVARRHASYARRDMAITVKSLI